MKKLFSFNVFLYLTAITFAQQYNVASVTNDVRCISNGEWKKVAVRDVLTANDIVIIGEQSALSVIDRKESRIYSLGASDKAPLTKIIKSQNKSVLGKFAERFWDSLIRGDTEKVSFEANVVYKDLDSDMGIYAALHNSDNLSHYPVSMELIDYINGNLIVNQASIGCKFIFRVTNDSNTPLFINVLNIDSEENYFDCLPVDRGLTMLHLLIPAHSVVDLVDYTMEFNEPAGVDSLILIASEVPFDLRNVIRMFETSAPAEAISGKNGIFRLKLNVK